MKYGHSLSPCLGLKPPLPHLVIVRVNANNCWSRRKKKSNCVLRISAASYQKLVQSALSETKLHTVLEPSSLQERFGCMNAMDGKTELQMLSYVAPKIRLLRSMSIQNESMQVLDFAAFPELEFDVPIFCANFFTAADKNIVVLDLNPLHDVRRHRDYKEKYYNDLMPLCLKYIELLPWGGKLTAESIKFFSPTVIWTKFSSSQFNHEVLFSAFMEYYQAWLKLMDQAVEAVDASQVICNREAQHRYLTWRAEKDPGHGILKRLIGENTAKDLMRNFLFNGINELGSKTFLDYFPEYRRGDGTVNEKRSMIGRSFETRPWDTRGEFIGDNF